MKKYLLQLILIFNCVGLTAHNVVFKHNWDIQYLDYGIQFKSKSPAPFPFSEVGEPQAVMIVSTDALNSKSQGNLDQIVKDEVAGIRRDLIITDYLDNDYKPVKNVVTYYSKIGNYRIAVIKYRTFGSKDKKQAMPRSARQILFVKDNKLWTSTLLILYAVDQINIIKDQMTFIEGVLNPKK